MAESDAKQPLKDSTWAVVFSYSVLVSLKDLSLIRRTRIEKLSHIFSCGIKICLPRLWERRNYLLLCVS